VRLVAIAEHDRVAANPFALRILSEVIYNGVECAGKINVVAVDERNDVSRRFRESLVDCVDLPAIFFSFSMRQSMLVFPNDRNAFICAAAVDNDVFERLVALIENGQDRLFQEAALVE